MTIAWIVYVLLVGGLLSVGAWCIEDALRAVKMPTRWVWAAALMGTVAFAAYALRAPAGLEASALLAHATTAANTAAPAQPAHGLLGSMEALRTTVARAMLLPMSLAGARVPERFVAIGLAFWLAASAVLLLMHLTVSGRVFRQRSEWPITTLPGGDARVAPALGPAVIGLTSPEIVVPKWLLEKSREEQRLVMVHEQEHIAAGDQFLPFGALLIATLLPWHPAVWWCVARLRLAVELDCDARVLRGGVHARLYGSLLIDIAAQCGGHRAGAIALADRASHLERRIRAMTHNRIRTGSARTITVAGMAAFAIVAACEARVPTAAEISKMDVSAAEKAATAVMLPAEGGPMKYDYLVDEKPTTEAEARAIPGSRIASLSMAKPKGAEAGAKGVVIIHTVEYEAAHPSASLRKRVAQGGAERSPTDVYIPYGKDAPLVVIDGVIAEEGVITKLRSTDVASVEVLKGAAAKAAWSQPAAANGVITITTKAAAVKAGP